ncbi:AraC family transcriptional regulator N-terminal domain-containing protein [Paraburkholderia sp. GAS82]|uniref:AraC family transcriptional regulator N-terminal domain-containing protein n=1 Tax=Paraburkholderia sp. GAS82 TaxID=3035137 RepID=UPI003D25C3C3
MQGQSQILVSAVDGDIPTVIGGLLLSRRTSPSPVVHLAQGPMFGMVMQGNKSMRLGNEVQHYGVGRLSARIVRRSGHVQIRCPRRAESMCEK